ncbi:MAG TPA: hypothetical protein VG942_08140 [Hyphomonadaceae bacterium]|nr:hypothetical protein [Hyphomonadaceae bacterium]
MALFNFDYKDRPLASNVTFASRMVGNIVFATIIIALALAAGMAGYHFLENLNWIDAFLNASMILGGMGPVAELKTDAGKLFAGGYALFAGLLFVLLSGVVLAPVLHRVLHALHVDDDDKS